MFFTRNMSETNFCVIIISICQITSSFATYEKWIPQSVNRTDLRCPISCDTESCCICNAIPSWQLDFQTKFLKVEYIRRDGTAIIDDEDKLQSRLVHRNGFLSSFPRNLCSFDIVEVDLQHNFIHNMVDISCLSLLDTLDLSFNLISRVGRGLISSLPLLRVLNLRNNMIKSLEPYDLAGTTIGLFKADLSYNLITKLDISNIIPEHHFCNYNYSHNKIDEIINEENFKLDVNKVYQGGFVDIASNLITQFVDWEDIGIADIRILGKVMQFGFSLLHMKWECDCRMESYLELSEDIANRIWRDFFNLTCWNPPQYRGLSIPNYFLKGDRLDLLICNISTSDKCPRYCNCYEQPQKRRTVVNCTGAGLTELPDYLPEADNLTLIFKDNNIKRLEDRQYLNQAFSIDLSNNSLREISNDAFQKMKRDILLDLSDNNIVELPRSVQTFDPCSTHFGKLIVTCDCSHSWITDWIKNKNGQDCSNTTDIFCQIEGKTISFIKIDWNSFCQGNNDLYFLNILLGVLFTIILVLSTFIYFFRYEIFILTRELTIRNNTKIHPSTKYDVFISFNDKDDKLRQWVIRCLDPFLRLFRYRTFIPCRDEALGVNREEALIDKINYSRNYIVILCERFSTEDAYFTTIEWKHLWNNYREHRQRKIIIINYDQIDSFHSNNRKVKAFLRIGKDIDFSNRNHLLLDDIKKRLGEPFQWKYRLTNAKAQFATDALNRKDIFTIDI